MLYRVTGRSMEPSFSQGDYLLVSRTAYHGASPVRGDAIILADPVGRDRHLLKRVIGLPHEEVCISDGTLLIDGDPLQEQYLAGLPASVGMGERIWRLADGEFFVMGDNRPRSTDSREFGPVGLDRMLGKATLRFWPPGRWGLLG